jgi:5'-nucleotidase
MNILLTNDDGISSPGLHCLADALRGTGKHRVGIVAPDRDRSGVSNSLTAIKTPIKYTENKKDEFSCSGTPADCVLTALLGRKPFLPDVVVAGINRGQNLGSDIIYSGTCGAARQASFLGVPGVALSLDADRDLEWEMAARYAAAHIEEYYAMWEEGLFVNVNIPNRKEGPLGSLVTRPTELKYYHDGVKPVEAPDGNTWFFFIYGEATSEDGEGSDWDAVAKGYASISLIKSQASAAKMEG